MGWFDPPAIGIRKLVPDTALSDLSKVEVFARHTLDHQPKELSPYQLGIVLSSWVKAGEISQSISISAKASKKIQSIYESCIRTIGSDSSVAFSVLEELSEQDGTFGVPSSMYAQLKINSLMNL